MLLEDRQRHRDGGELRLLDLDVPKPSRLCSAAAQQHRHPARQEGQRAEGRPAASCSSTRSRSSWPVPPGARARGEAATSRHALRQLRASVRFRYEFSSPSVTSTVSALPEPFGCAASLLDRGQLAARATRAGRERQRAAAGGAGAAAEATPSDGHEGQGHRSHAFDYRRAQRRAGQDAARGSVLRLEPSGPSPPRSAPRRSAPSRSSSAPARRAPPRRPGPERHPQLGHRLLAVAGARDGARPAAGGCAARRGRGRRRAISSRSGARVVARLREPLGAAQQARRQLGAGAAAPVAASGRSERRIRSKRRGQVGRRQRLEPGASASTRLPFLVRLRRRGPPCRSAQARTSAGVAVERGRAASTRAQKLRRAARSPSQSSAQPRLKARSREPGSSLDAPGAARRTASARPRVPGAAAPAPGC